MLQTHGWSYPSPNESDHHDNVPLLPGSIKSLQRLDPGPKEGTTAHRVLQDKMKFSYRQVLGELIYAYIVHMLSRFLLASLNPLLMNTIMLYVVSASTFVAPRAGVLSTGVTSLSLHSQRSLYQPHPLLIPRFPHSPPRLCSNSLALSMLLMLPILPLVAPSPDLLSPLLVVPLHISQNSNHRSLPPPPKLNSLQPFMLPKLPSTFSMFWLSSDILNRLLLLSTKTIRQPLPLSMKIALLLNLVTLTFSTSLFRNCAPGESFACFTS